MDWPNKPDTHLTQEEKEALLHEYDSLRAELKNTQSQRFQIVTFMLAAVAVIITFSGSKLLDPASYGSTAGSTFQIPTEAASFVWQIAIGTALTLYAIIIPSLYMTREAQRSISTIGAYIRKYIEPIMPGLNWETRQGDVKELLQNRSGMRGMGGIFLLFSFVPLLFPLYVYIQVNTQGYLFVLLLLFSLWPFILSVDLHKQCSGTWLIAQWPEKKPIKYPWHSRLKKFIVCCLIRRKPKNSAAPAIEESAA